MEIEGIHHITAITGDVKTNVDFYARVLGLRIVKKTVNFDMPNVYHLYYADPQGTPGTILTFFEFPGAAPGRAGAGMIHLIAWSVPEDSLERWQSHLETAGVASEIQNGRLRFADPEGLHLELVGEPGRSMTGELPALTRFHSVRAFATSPLDSKSLLTSSLGFTELTHGYSPGGSFGQIYSYDQTTTRGIEGGGTVHHIAFAVPPSDHERWRQRLADAGLSVTPIIDRTYFKSIYFREPSGVLFEVATIGPGFAVDESPDHLGESLTLPERYEPLREQLEKSLTPIP